MSAGVTHCGSPTGPSSVTRPAASIVRKAKHFSCPSSTGSVNSGVVMSAAFRAVAFGGVPRVTSYSGRRAPRLAPSTSPSASSRRARRPTRPAPAEPAAAAPRRCQIRRRAGVPRTRRPRSASSRRASRRRGGSRRTTRALRVSSLVSGGAPAARRGRVGRAHGDRSSIRLRRRHQLRRRRRRRAFERRRARRPRPDRSPPASSRHDWPPARSGAASCRSSPRSAARSLTAAGAGRSGASGGPFLPHADTPPDRPTRTTAAAVLGSRHLTGCTATSRRFARCRPACDRRRLASIDDRAAAELRRVKRDFVEQPLHHGVQPPRADVLGALVDERRAARRCARSRRR